jgi:PXPV repeat (3 copies)
MKRIVTRLLVATGLAIGAVGAAQAADLHIGVSVGAPVYARPAPVYVRPGPVYSAPQWHRDEPRWGMRDNNRWDHTRWDRNNNDYHRGYGDWNHRG